MFAHPDKGQPLDQTSASRRADSARPNKIIDQSPVSRPKSRATVTARGAVSVASPDFPNATGTVFLIPIFVRLFPDQATLIRTAGYFWPELCSASKSVRLLQLGHIDISKRRRSSSMQDDTELIGWCSVVIVATLDAGVEC